MIDYVKAIFLGLVEGMTEFLPISSTAHLLILTEMIGFKGPSNHVFEIFIQLGAIFAVVFYYRKKLIHTGLTCFTDSQSRHFTLLLIICTIPALVMGFLGRDHIKESFYHPKSIAIALIAGGIFMLFFERVKKAHNITRVDDIPLVFGLVIGCFQALALIPGVSRSGATIIGGLSLGLSRPAAAEFSFFAAIPVMFAAVAYDTLKSFDDITSGGYVGVMLAGFCAAFFSALLVISIALKLIGKYGFAPYAFYRIAAGIFILGTLY